MTELLSVSKLSVSYGKVAALQEMSLTVPEGSIVTVIGPNGAGKSTLLNAVMGLLPSRGEVRYAGQSINALSVDARVARGLCLVPERGRLFTELSVEDNLSLGAFTRYARGDRQFAVDIRDIYTRFPQLEKRHAQLAGTLSGGERQMLALGRALMAKPRLLMLDEPSLGLAPLLVKEIIRAIKQLKTLGVSVLLVEQNARAALQIADYGYVLETGSIALEGTAVELSANPRIVETYLGLGRSASALGLAKR